MDLASDSQPRHCKLKDSSNLIHLCLVSIFAGLYYGINAGIVSGLSESITKCSFFLVDPFVTEMNSMQASYNGLLVGSILMGAIVGVVSGVPIAEKFGRVKAFRLFGLNGLFCFLFNIVPSDEFWVTFFLRLFCGLPIGALTAICPLYVTEVSPPNIRGALGTVMQMAIAGGLFLSEFINFAMSPDYNASDIDECCIPPNAWKLQLSIGGIPALLLLLHSFVLPESQVWLKKQRGVVPLDEPLLEGGNAEEDSLRQPQEAITWREFFTLKNVKWMFIGAGLGLSTMLTGMDAIMFYSAQIFDQSFGANATFVTMFCVGLFNFLCVFLGTYLVENGRKPLMTFALAGMTLCNTLLAVSYGAFDGSLQQICLVAGIMGFILFFEIGPGSLFFILASETFDEHIRPKAIVFTNIVQWIANLLVAFLFPVLTEGLGETKTFALLSVICVFSTLFCAKVLPETKD